ncbi:hypothetical protein SLEP1_g44579 [Rubroshorea leprosula]|uniref:F-box/LRR-repeat protein 15-like leucin rich repeat domain-containing protein n=1 Tax=Rubroshorea leprosula TaxID=152421 RepID=A0AAV5LII3_9ROSI|nr:hypothetical protein SLEP1_g44579 [Rubroshorea leprosula]
MEQVPIEEILWRLDLESLCSLACVNKALCSSVLCHLRLLSSLHLPTLCPDALTLNHILGKCSGVKTLNLNCLRLQDSSLCAFLSPNLLELNLLGGSFFSHHILASIGQSCPNLRVLTVELAAQESSHAFKSNLARLLERCLCLECLCLKIRGIEVDAIDLRSIEFFIPKTIKTLKLQPVLEQDATDFINKLGVGRNVLETYDCSKSLPPTSSGFTLQRLRLVLDLISDALIRTIIHSLSHLVDLDLEDRPYKDPPPHHDLTNNGLQVLGCCKHLRGLSLVRSRQNQHGMSFKRINDMGMFLLSEGCKDLESVRLCGFSKVSDAGFASILHSCQNLKQFEVRNALFLSDLAFHDLSKTQYALVEVRLLACNLITSEAVKELASFTTLEVLDFGGCKSLADSCLGPISYLPRLTALNLTGADITDSGLLVLGEVSPPLTRLCLRGCKRVTDKGVSFLLRGGGITGKTLEALDLGHMPGISDKAIFTVAEAGIEITELCIRFCFRVTDSSLEALAKKRTFQDGSKQLRRLDLYNCISLSVDGLRLLKRPLFCGLHWLGIGNTRLACQSDSLKAETWKERPWLTMCLDGCEMGCHDGWQFHVLE